MKNLLLIAIVFSLTASLPAQTTARPTAAVADPNVQGFHIGASVAAKMMRFELYKVNLFQVYDEFDMAEVIQNDSIFGQDCYGVECLCAMGEKLKVDYIFSGSFDNLSDRIVITLKVVDVKEHRIYKSSIKEFVRQESDLQRMIEFMICDMYGIPFDAAVAEGLKFKNDPITANQHDRINNTGPRIGCSALTGSLNEFARRPESQGGLDIFPMTSMLGYQVEWQYVGTENFSALVECIFNITGMEQGRIIPSFDLLNGFRFGSSGWEIGLGPGFGLATTSKGFFDTENYLGKGKDFYFSESDWDAYSFEQYGEITPLSSVYPNYSFSTHFDTRGATQLNTFWIFAGGRTFRAGSLNIPVNIFYTNMHKGGYFGASVGFNVLKQKDKQPSYSY